MGARLIFSDEMRLGRRGQVRRRWALKGKRMVQKLQIKYDYTYLLLGLDPLRGTLYWSWVERMKQDLIIPEVEKWQVDGIVWDGAGSHRGKKAKALDIPLIQLPPYCPELNPVERFFQEIRRTIEGFTYATLEDKIKKAEEFLTQLADDPQRVINIVGWDWIVAELLDLPTKIHAAS